MNSDKIISELKREFDLAHDADIRELQKSDEAINAFEVAGIEIPDSWNELAAAIRASYSELASEIKLRAGAE